ncbi:hypothetical protein HPB47_018070 [Ixodes persulcatus]|uniref:Uncharacterized protein n=1 Tax=Ixodes persulcatus TaxID=34615 RepID=A0AC60QLU7_IXOPE|nr:hypothetical protein HPB47_018070 [Ixodes persulcatus]
MEQASVTAGKRRRPSQDTTSDQAPTVAGATTILCAGALRQRDPKLFSGIGDDDIEDWLESVERNIMKGIAEDAFQILVVKAPATVSEVIDICQNFSELRLQRLPAKRKPEPPAELASLTTAIEGSVDKWAELRCVIQEIVRDEVARQLGKPSTCPESFISPSIRALIQDQVTAAIPCAVMPPAASPPLVPQSYAAPPQAQYRPALGSGRLSDQYSSQDYAGPQPRQRQGRSPSPRRRSLSPLRPRTTSPIAEGHC